MAKKQKPLPTTSGGFAAFMERELASSGPVWRYGRWDLWREFLTWELAFLQSDAETVAACEARKPDAVETWKQWRDALHEATKASPYDDHLGVAYMLLGMGSPGFAQYFTPGPVARLLAACSAHDFEDRPNGPMYRGLEPCVGSGVMVLAAEAVRKEHGKQSFLWMLMDLDPVCCMMAAIQCCLNDIPAVVLCTNSLAWGAPGHETARLVSPRVSTLVGGKPKVVEEVTQAQADLILVNLEAHALEAMRLNAEVAQSQALAG